VRAAWPSCGTTIYPVADHKEQTLSAGGRCLQKTFEKMREAMTETPADQKEKRTQLEGQIAAMTYC